MPIPITCPVCGQSYQLRDEMAGKSIHCRCGQAIAAPESASVFNLLDELPPATCAPSSPAAGLTNQQTSYGKRRSAARPPWLIPAVAASALGVPSLLVIVCVILFSGRRGEPPAGGMTGGQLVVPASSEPASPREDELTRIRAAGEPVSFADLDAYYPVPPADQDATQLWLAGIAPLDSPQFKASANGLPFVSDGPDRIPVPGNVWPQLAAAETLLMSYRTSLDEIHQAARRGGRARFPVQFAAGSNMPLPHADRLRAASRLLALESAVAAHRGNSDAAVDSIVAMFAADRSIEQEPILVVQLVRMAMGAMARGRVEWLLSAAALNDAQLARLDAELAASDYALPVRRALVGERVIGIAGFVDPVQTLIGMGMDGQRAGDFPKSAEDEPMYLQIMSEMIAVFEKTGPARTQAAQAVDNKLQQLTSSPGTARRYPLALLVAPAVGACANAASRNEAERDAMRAAVTIERFYGSEGRLPSKIDELSPRFLSSLPIDPCDGQPLRYRVEPTEYLIYSVGPDGVDDGGRPAAQGQAGDSVVRVRRKDAEGRR